VLAHLDAQDNEPTGDEDEDEVVAGPVHIAVDMNEASDAPGVGA
jgi:hypothetical protein